MEESLILLAEKLGTTVEYLWPLMIKQQYVQVWHSVIPVILSTITGIASIKTTKYFCQKPNDNEDDAVWIGIGGIMVLVSFAVFTIGICWFASDLVDLMNPEYAALVDILELIRGC